MKPRSFALFIISIFLYTLSHAQTAADIITKHINAIGGKDKLAAIKTIYTEGEINLTKCPARVIAKNYHVNGKGHREELLFTELKLSVIETFTDGAAWSVNPFTGKPTPGVLSAEQASAGRLQLVIGGPLLHYEQQGHKAELIGKETIHKTEAYKLKLVTKDSCEFIYWIDQRSYYILKMTVHSKTGEQLRTAVYADYKQTEKGIVLPHAVEFTMAQSTVMVVIFQKVEINKDIDPSVFVMPKE